MSSPPILSAACCEIIWQHSGPWISGKPANYLVRKFGGPKVFAVAPVLSPLLGWRSYVGLVGGNGIGVCWQHADATVWMSEQSGDRIGFVCDQVPSHVWSLLSDVPHMLNVNEVRSFVKLLADVPDHDDWMVAQNNVALAVYGLMRGGWSAEWKDETVALWGRTESGRAVRQALRI